MKTLKQRIEEFENHQRAQENERQKQKQREEMERREFENQCTVNGNIVVKLNSKEYNGPIEIPEGTTRIEKEAFRESKISSVKLPTTSIEIGELTFFGCSSLSSIKIPSSITQIGNCSSTSTSREDQIHL